MDVFELSAKITADNSEYEKALSTASQDTKTFGNKLKTGLGTAAKVGAVAVGALTTAIGAASAAAVKAVNKTAEYGDAIDKNSQKLGITAKTYQEWEAVLQHSGTSMDSMGASFKKLATASQNASDKQVDAFKKIGLSMEDVKNMSTDELWEKTIKGLQGMKSGTERTATATQLLGKGAQELGALFNTSAEDTQKMIDTVNDLGGVMSDDAVKACAEYEDNVQDLSTAFEGAKRNLASEFMPALNDTIKGLTKLFSGEGGLDEITKGVEEFAGKLKETFGKLGSGVVDGIKENILPALSDIPSKVGDLASNVQAQLPKWKNAGIDMASEFISGLTGADQGEVKKFFNKMADNAQSQFNRMLKVGKKAFDSLSKTFKKCGDNFSGIGKTFKNGAGKIINTIGDMSNKVRDTMVTAFEKIMPIVTDMMDNLLPVITGFIDDVLPILMDLLGKAADTISNIADEVLPVLLDIGQKVMDVIKDIIETVLPPILDLIKNIAEAIAPVIEAIMGFIENVAPAVIDVIKGIIDAISPFVEVILNLIKNVLGPVVDVISDIVKVISDTLTPIVEGLGDVFGDAFEEVGEYLSAFGEMCKDGFEVVGDYVTGFKLMVSDAIDAIGEYLIAAKEMCSDAFSAIADVVTDIFGGIWDFIKGFVNGFLSGIEMLVNGVISAINFLIDGIDTVVGAVGDLFGQDWSVPHIPEVSLPRLAKGGVVDHATIAEIGEDGPEAVIPLKNNTEWIDSVANRMGGSYNDELLGQCVTLLEKVVDNGNSLPKDVANALDGVTLGLNRREFGRLVKAVQ